MRKITIMLFGLFAFVSCGEKIDKSKPAAPYKYPIIKNEYRVSMIEGKNNHWGEFKMNVYYNINDQLDSALITDKNNRRIGNIKSSFPSTGEKSSVTRIMDVINGISQDSIERMDAILKSKYGEGNYSLLDSIPKSSQTIMLYAFKYYYDDRIASVNILSNIQRINTGTSGIDFNAAYVKKAENKYRYEYNLDGKICVVRTVIDEYEADETKLINNIIRTDIFKRVISFNSGKVEHLEDYILLAGEDFSKQNEFAFNYSGGNLSSINYGGVTITFVRSGNRLTITNKDEIKNYELDGNSYPVRIDDNEGNYMKITYETGHGDFGNLTSEFEKALGYPYIR